MLPLNLRYVWQYGMDTYTIMTNQLDHLQNPLAQYPHQPHPPEVALDHRAQQYEVGVDQ